MVNHTAKTTTTIPSVIKTTTTMPIIKQTKLASIHTVLDPEEFIANNRWDSLSFFSFILVSHLLYYLVRNGVCL